MDLAQHIVFQDDHLVVVDKPFGLPSQRTADGREGVVELLQRQRSTATLVHRLDQTASGLLVVALSPLAASALSAAFRDRSAGRTYLAVLAGPTSSTTWEMPIDGKAARTLVEPIAPARDYQAVRLRLETGRTHQIRRHAALAGLPIVGDRRYGGLVSRGWPRLALHAWILELTHPQTNARMRWEAPLPQDLTTLWRMATGHSSVGESREGRAPP